MKAALGTAGEQTDMFLSICLGHKFEIPGFQFSLEELWTQREGLQLNYSPLSPPRKKKQNNAPPAKGKEKKREKNGGDKVSLLTKDWQWSPAATAN